MQIGGGPKKTAFAAQSAFSAQTNRRLEPAHSDEGSVNSEFTQAVTAPITVPEHNFEIAYQARKDGAVEISYILPEDTENVFLGLWNQFAFYVRTLVNEKNQSKGRQVVIWNGKDDQGNAVGEGLYICRMSTDGQQGGSQMIELPGSA